MLFVAARLTLARAICEGRDWNWEMNRTDTESAGGGNSVALTGRVSAKLYTVRPVVISPVYCQRPNRHLFGHLEV